MVLQRQSCRSCDLLGGFHGEEVGDLHGDGVEERLLALPLNQPLLAAV